jgi:hypothetical protein
VDAPFPHQTYHPVAQVVPVQQNEHRHDKDDRERGEHQRGGQPGARDQLERRRRQVDRRGLRRRLRGRLAFLLRLRLQLLDRLRRLGELALLRRRAQLLQLAGDVLAVLGQLGGEAHGLRHGHPAHRADHRHPEQHGDKDRGHAAEAPALEPPHQWREHERKQHRERQRNDDFAREVKDGRRDHEREQRRGAGARGALGVGGHPRTIGGRQARALPARLGRKD